MESFDCCAIRGWNVDRVREFISSGVPEPEKTLKKTAASGRCNRSSLVSRQCRFAGIPNLMVQSGHSHVNFGFVGLATLTPVNLVPQPLHLKGSRNIWQWRTRQERQSLPDPLMKSNASSARRRKFLRKKLLRFGGIALWHHHARLCTGKPTRRSLVRARVCSFRTGFPGAPGLRRACREGWL